MSGGARSGLPTNKQSSALSVDVLDKDPGDATVALGVEAANVIEATIQLLDRRGANLGKAARLAYYLSDDDAGLTPSTVGPSVGISATTGAIEEATASLSGWLYPTAAGAVVLDIEEAGVLTRYLNLVMPDGRIVTSAAIIWA